MDVRKAEATDIEAAVELVERSRRQFQKYQPTFWRKAAKSAAATETFFTKLLAEPDTVFLVAVEGGQQQGFLIARKFPNPPVFDPGGDTWLVDDFCVAEPHFWLSVGEALRQAGLRFASGDNREHFASRPYVPDLRKAS